MYALILTSCLLNGQCHGTAVDVFYTLQDCKAEYANQVLQGLPAYNLSCEFVEDEQ